MIITDRIRIFVGVILWILYFLLINFEPTMASVFFAFLLGSSFLYYLDKKKTLFLEKPGNNRLKSVVMAVVAYAAFIFSSAVVLGFLKLTGTISAGSVIDVYSQFLGSMMAQYSPALAGNVFLTFVSWGWLIPPIETFAFFIVLFELLTDYFFKTHISIKDPKTWMAGLAVAIGFVLFHLTSKGITNTPALIMTLIFALISVILVLMTHQALEAVIFHIMVNSISIIVSMHILATISPMIIAIIIGFIIYLIIRNLKVRL